MVHVQCSIPTGVWCIVGVQRIMIMEKCDFDQFEMDYMNSRLTECEFPARNPHLVAATHTRLAASMQIERPGFPATRT